MDVVAWLRSLGLGHYAEAFRANDIDADVLPELTAEDLVGLGVTSIGHRRKLLAAIAALRGGPAPATGLPTDGRSTPAADAAAAAPLPDGERRQVAVLFADLTAYTALRRELDAEELHALADLIGARLAAANLSEARLTRADLREANLEGADLEGADLVEVSRFCVTSMPDGSRCNKDCEPGQSDNRDCPWLQPQESEP